MAACYISPVTLTLVTLILVHSDLEQRLARALPLDQTARVCELMYVRVALGKYSPGGPSQCYGGIDPPPPPPPPSTQSDCKKVGARHIRDTSFK
jgi:hypothetical protein